MNFRIRLHANEQLDNLSLSGTSLLKTLSSLKLINKLFGNHKQLTKSILEYCGAQPTTKPFQIIDLGCGGGDSIYKISNKLGKKSIQASFIGIDGNPQSIAYARSQYMKHDHIEFRTENILDTGFIIPQCDVIISSHFMYHFKDDELVKFINEAQQKGIKHLIFSELKRNKIAYFLFKFSSFILPISKVAKKDGLVAIRRAFTVNELESILNKSNVKNYSVGKKFWFRTLTKIDL
ncbi:methyltransferase domain-containing protein [uncultured Aquimarina sp.]|uniref:methyltransferase domain-containing protein n=1 Tax=uncultured Aquimarina sp. TaxID=575652 RepID=UPI0026378CB2|nr:methyltransferase domain-containing protein [uncultured Aquimarina sp.]